MTRMSSDVRDRWVAALRSGRFVQGRLRLTTVRDDVTRHCCLGVLCELALEAGVELTVKERELSTGARRRTYDNITSYPPDAVLAWAGLDVPDPSVTVPFDGVGRSFRLSDLNDDLYWTFTQIADVVEGQL